MPNTDDTPAPEPTPRPRTQPSLLGDADAAGRAAPISETRTMRMLDELEAVVRPRTEAHSSALRGRVVALLGAGVVLAGAAWWWTHHDRTAPAAASAKAFVVSAPPAASATQMAANTQPAQADAAVSASARIESVVPAAATPTEPEALQKPTAPVPAAKPTPHTATAAVARAAAPKESARKVTTVVTPSGKWTTTVTRADTTPTLNTPRVASAKSTNDKTTNDEPLASPADPVARADAVRNPKADDADVVLLSALLAHVSRDGAGGLAEQDQLTIAQLVKRCDARAPPEARDCRRRICEGYWGKAEACPAPKKG